MNAGYTHNKQYEIEIILATYNGEKYIIEQLESIRTQTLKADIVSIYDDKSSDNTVRIIREYISRHHLTNWFLYINENNIGWRKNFIKAMSKTLCKYIFFCDQDDVWKKEKVERMINILRDKTDIKVLVSDYEEFYEKDADYIRINKKLGDDNLNCVIFNLHFNEIRRPGCTMVFRNTVINRAQILKTDFIAHDQAVWLAGILDDGLYYLNEKLIMYRRHKGNASPISGHTKTARINELMQNIEIADSILQHKVQLKYSDSKERIICKYRSFMSNRLFYLKEGNIFGLLCMITKVSYYPKFSSWLGDIYVLMKNKKVD